MQYNHFGKLRKVLMCPPTFYKELTISEGAARSVDSGDLVNREVAKKQHDGLVAAIRQAGVEVVLEEPQPDHAWQVFTRDIGIMTPAGALIGKFKYRERWNDEDAAIETMTRLGYKITARISVGAVEGGDSWLLDEHTLVIGSGNRSTLRGIAQAAEVMKPFGIEVVAVEFLSKWNHLDGIFAIIDDKLAIACRETLPEFFLKLLKARGFRTIDVTAAQVDELVDTTNVLALGGGKIVSFEDNKWMNERLRAEGFEVIAPPLREFTKMGGGPHCLTFELDRDR